MKIGIMIGIALVALGAIGLAYDGIGWTTRETVVDIAGVKVEADKDHTFPIHPIASGVMLGAGAVVLVVSMKK